MAIEDAIRELTEVVKGSDESPEPEVTYIEAPANPSDGDTLTYDATSGKWVAGAAQGGDSSALPEVTRSDLGKVMSVVEDESRAELFTMYSNDALEIEGYGVCLENVEGLDSLEEGTLLVLTADGVSYEASWDTGLTPHRAKFYLEGDQGDCWCLIDARDVDGTVPLDLPQSSATGTFSITIQKSQPAAKWDKAAPLQMYGPYYATNSEAVTCNAGLAADAECDTYYNFNYEEVELPNDICDFILAGFRMGASSGGGKCYFGSTELPGKSDSEWYNASVSISNFTESPAYFAAESLEITFYATHELLPKAQAE